MKLTEDAPQADPEEIRALKADNARLRRQLGRKEGGEGLIAAAVADAFSGGVDLRIRQPAKPGKSSRKPEEVAVLHVSDTQLGKTTDTYSLAIADERLQRLASKALRITETRRSSSRIRELRIYLGGDMVEGEDIFPGQAHEIEQGVFEQAVNSGPSILARMILKLVDGFDKVRVVCVVGNHGRNTRFASPHTNWDRVLYSVLGHMLQGPATPAAVRKRLEFVIPEEWYAVDRIYDWGNLIIHGDQIKGQLGFPWYGLGKKMAGWIDSIPHPWDYIWLGHFHTYAGPLVINERIALANGTTESGNVYAQEQLAASGHPCQRLAFFDAEHGLIADNQVFLTGDGDRLPARRRAMRWA